MKNKDFDHFIKQQLNSVQQGADMPGWDSFVSLLDREMKNDSFDHQIKESLKNIQENYRESHWHLFLNRLAIVKLFTQDLIYNKAFEAILLILALAFIFPKPFQEYPTDTFAKITTENYQDKSILISLETSVPLNVKGSENFDSESGFLMIFEQDNSISTETENDKSPALVNTDQNNFEAGVTSLLKPVKIAYLKMDYLSPVARNPLKFEINKFKTEPNSIDPLLPISLLEFPQPFYCNEPALPKKSKLEVFTETNTVVSVFSTLDINSIHTPYDAIYLRNGYEQSKLGLGGGFSIGWAQDRWTFETGMVFSMKQYNPKSILEIFRFNPDEETAQAISLKAIELNTLSIPLHVRFDLHQRRKLTPYLLGGVGLNLATHANYEREQFVFALSRPIPPNAEVSTATSPRLEEKRFQDGLIQGGSFNENYFLSLNSGIGLDYQLGRHWQLFKEVNYHYNFMQKELGPNNDRINTFSFKLGARHIMYHKSEIAL